MKTPEQIAADVIVTEHRRDGESFPRDWDAVQALIVRAIAADRAQAAIPGGPEQIAGAVLIELHGAPFPTVFAMHDPIGAIVRQATVAGVRAGITAAWESWEPESIPTSPEPTDLIKAYEAAQQAIRDAEFPELMIETVTDDGETFEALRCPECMGLVDSESLIAVSPAEHHATAEDAESDDAFEHCRITFYGGDRPDLEETLYYLHNQHPVALPEGWTEDWS